MKNEVTIYTLLPQLKRIWLVSVRSCLPCIKIGFAKRTDLNKMLGEKMVNYILVRGFSIFFMLNVKGKTTWENYLSKRLLF